LLQKVSVVDFVIEHETVSQGESSQLLVFGLVEKLEDVEQYSFVDRVQSRRS
jgi:hypothetical protein